MFSQVEAAEGRAACAEAALDPFFEVFDVSNLVHVILHHVHVASLHQNLLTITHRLEQVFISLLFLDNLLLCTEILALLSYLLFEDVFSSQFSQLLLKHQLVVLVAHKFFNLFLTALQFDHNLFVPLLDRLTVVALSMAAVLKGLLSRPFALLILRELLFVEASHFSRPLFSGLLSSFKTALHVRMLFVTVRGKFLTKGLITSSKVFLAKCKALMVSVGRVFQLRFMLLKIFDNTLPFLRLKSAVVLVDLQLTLLLFFQEFLDAIQPLFLKLLNLGVPLSVVGLSFLVSLSLSNALSFLCICEALLCLLLLLLLALLEDLHVRLYLHVGCGEDFIESGSLLLVFYLAGKLIADFHRSRVS